VTVDHLSAKKNRFGPGDVITKPSESNEKSNAPACCPKKSLGIKSKKVKVTICFITDALIASNVLLVAAGRVRRTKVTYFRSKFKRELKKAHSPLQLSILKATGC
jgi:hypothetical protein